MAKLLYSVTMSVDGFIAGAGGDMGWMTEYLGPDPLVDDLVPQIGSLLVGRRTFGGDDPHKGTDKEGSFAGDPTWVGGQFVVTHNPPADPVPGVTFVADVPAGIEGSRAAADAAGRPYVNVLGASVARQCIELGALDEVLVLIAPVLLGDGTRVFEHPGGTHVKLERLSMSEAPLASNLWFRVLG